MPDFHQLQTENLKAQTQGHSRFEKNPVEQAQTKGTAEAKKEYLQPLPSKDIIDTYLRPNKYKVSEASTRYFQASD